MRGVSRSEGESNPRKERKELSSTRISAQTEQETKMNVITKKGRKTLNRHYNKHGNAIAGEGKRGK
jgi:hypothetical protein